MSEQLIFRNEQVDLDSLPGLDGIEYNSLHPNYLTAQNISVGIFAIVVAGTFSVVFLQEEVPFWLKIALAGLYTMIIGSAFTIVNVGFRHKGYALRERDLVYKRGWIYKKQTTVPFTRIQHLDIKQGVIERFFGLAKLGIYTAGGTQSDMSIPGLQKAEAGRLKAFILDTHFGDEEE